MVGRLPDRGLAAISRASEGQPGLLAELLSLDDEGLAALDGLVTALLHLRGHPGLVLAFCDSPLLRDRVIAEIQARLPDLTTYTFVADERHADLLPWLAEVVPPGSDVAFVTGIEQAFPDAVRYLNYRREVLARFCYPIVMWLPSRLEAVLRKDAPDFWAFRRHTFFFRLYAPWVSQISHKMAVAGARGDPEALRASIAVHRQLLADVEQAGTGKTVLAGILRRNLGELLLQAQEWSAAHRELEQALDILRAAEADSAEIASVHLALGQTLYYLDEYAAARERYEEALPIYRAIGDRLGEANALLSLGDLARKGGRYPQAWDFYEQALSLYRTIGDRYSLGRVLHRMGDWSVEQGKAREAIPLYEQAIDLWRSIGLEDLVEQVLLPKLAPISPQASPTTQPTSQPIN